MSPLNYYRLFSQERKLLVAVLFGMSALVVWTMANVEPSGRPDAFWIIPTFMISVLVTQAGHQTMFRGSTALLPGFHRSFIRWSLAIALGFSVLWGLGASAAGLTFLPVAALTAAVVTMGLPLRRNDGSPQSRIMWPVVGVIVGATLMNLAEGDLMTILFVDHGRVTSAIGLAIAAANAWVASDRKRVRKLELAAQPAAKAADRRFTIGTDPSLRTMHLPLLPRGNSTIRWLSAFDEERQGLRYNQIIAILGIGLLAIFPMTDDDRGGYPLGWYRLVYDWGTSGVVGAVMSWVLIIGVGLVAPAPRRNHLYPVSRKRLASLMFMSTARSWGFLALVAIGTPLVAATLAGLWLELPVRWTQADRFVAAGLLSVCTLAWFRWSAFVFEGRSNPALVMVCVLGMAVTFIGWLVMTQLLPHAATPVGLLILAGSLAMYRQSLAYHFEHEDLWLPEPPKREL